MNNAATCEYHRFKCHCDVSIARLSQPTHNKRRINLFAQQFDHKFVLLMTIDLIRKQIFKDLSFIGKFSASDDLKYFPTSEFDFSKLQESNFKTIRRVWLMETQTKHLNCFKLLSLWFRVSKKYSCGIFTSFFSQQNVLGLLINPKSFVLSFVFLRQHLHNNCFN